MRNHRDSDAYPSNEGRGREHVRPDNEYKKHFSDNEHTKSEFQSNLISPVKPLSPESFTSSRGHSIPKVPPASSPPPPPSAAPPPPPPPESERNSTLPTIHSAVRIPLPKRPPTPVSLPFQKPEHVSKPELEKGEVEENPREYQPRPPRRRKPVQRTRSEERDAYGRIFEGCSSQDDYDVINKLGEGTFGEVHKAVHKTKGIAVALKRILMHNEKEGMPVTALREIKILKALHHPCIVDILDMFVIRSKGKESPLSVFMVFPYMDHDLAGLLENERVKLSPSQIKLYMKQLLEGTEYMHRNHILHRDMKAANLLISNTGSLKIADFGLARSFDPTIVDFKEDFKGRERKYTNCVVTRWYRPPELLLGARQYGGEVDMWGVGCVLGEMFWRRPILPGTSDLDQLDKIWQLCGSPNQHTWPNYDTLPGCEGVKRFNSYPRRLKQTYETIGPETCDLLDKMLTCNPRERITAAQALDHDYFWTDPLPADPKSLPTYEASHEFDKRGRRNQAPVGPPVQPTHAESIPRQLPVPTQPSSMRFNGRPPPPREAFRTGPPPPVLYFPSNLPPPPHAPHHSYPNVVPPPLPPVPQQLPPLSLRPGQPPVICDYPPAQPLPQLPFLPRRPQMPQGGRHHGRGGGGAAGGGYGGHPGGGSELNYG
ncbi:kinase-like domain-containing protein [Abortiporus biennis]|nr:kinase-like domain-containing protein [Abortiporus biennis]